MKKHLYMIEKKNADGVYEPVGIGTMGQAVEFYWESPAACKCHFIGWTTNKETTKQER